jgi:hypothetical protein
MSIRRFQADNQNAHHSLTKEDAMKNLYWICFAFILSLGGVTQASPTIDYSHFVTPQEGVLLQVTGVASDDVLNLRTAPPSDAPILYRKPTDAEN